MALPTLTTVPVIITGASPLLCGKPADLPDGLTPVQQARERLYLGSDHQPVIPTLNLARCLVGAGRLLNPPRSDLHQALDVNPSEIPIRSSVPWQVDTRTVRKPGTRERINCHRPRFDSWSLAFEVHVDTERIGLGVLMGLIELAGMRIGLGDYRVERGGPFGRFRLESWGPA